MLFAGGRGSEHLLDNVFLKIKGDFRDDDAGCADGDADIEREIPRPAPHHFDDAQRSCDWAVSRSLSIISIQVFSAVS